MSSSVTLILFCVRQGLSLTLQLSVSAGWAGRHLSVSDTPLTPPGANSFSLWNLNVSPQALVTGPPPSSLSILVLEVKISNASSTLHGKKKHGPLKGAGPLGLVFIIMYVCRAPEMGWHFPGEKWCIDLPLREQHCRMGLVTLGWSSLSLAF